MQIRNLTKCYDEEYQRKLWTIVLTLIDFYIVGTTLTVIYIAVRLWL
jgi:hypothetical protein